MEGFLYLGYADLLIFLSMSHILTHRGLQRVLPSLQAQVHLEEQLGASEIIPHFR